MIYELMLDDFTAEYRNGRAPLDAVHDKLIPPASWSERDRVHALDRVGQR